MDWKAHLFVGLLLGALVAYFVLHADALAFILFAVVSGASSLLPDLDMRKSKASQVLGMLALVAILIAAGWLAVSNGKNVAEFAVYALLLLASAFVADRLLRPRHRGIMHSLGFLGVVAIAAWLAFGTFFALAFGAGYFSHLLADGCVKFL